MQNSEKLKKIFAWVSLVAILGSAILFGVAAQAAPSDYSPQSIGEYRDTGQSYYPHDEFIDLINDLGLPIELESDSTDLFTSQPGDCSDRNACSTGFFCADLGIENAINSNRSRFGCLDPVAYCTYHASSSKAPIPTDIAGVSVPNCAQTLASDEEILAQLYSRYSDYSASISDRSSLTASSLDALTAFFQELEDLMVSSSPIKPMLSTQPFEVWQRELALYSEANELYDYCQELYATLTAIPGNEDAATCPSGNPSVQDLILTLEGIIVSHEDSLDLIDRDTIFQSFSKQNTCNGVQLTEGEWCIHPETLSVFGASSQIITPGDYMGKTCTGGQAVECSQNTYCVALGTEIIGFSDSASLETRSACVARDIWEKAEGRPVSPASTTNIPFFQNDFDAGTASPSPATPTTSEPPKSDLVARSVVETAPLAQLESSGLVAPDPTLVRGIATARTANELIGGILNFFLSFVSIVAVGVLIYGGFMYLTSGIVPGNADKGKQAIVGAVTGIILIISSWTIVNTVVNLNAGSFAGGENTERISSQGVVLFYRYGSSSGGSVILSPQDQAKPLPGITNATAALQGQSVVLECQVDLSMRTTILRLGEVSKPTCMIDGIAFNRSAIEVWFENL